MKKTTEQPLTKLADAAFEQAALKVIERAKNTGTPVIIWENDQVKWVQLPKQTRSKSRQRKTGAG